MADTNWEKGSFAAPQGGAPDWESGELASPAEAGFIPTVKRTAGQMMTTAATSADDVVGPNAVTKSLRETGQGIIDRNPAGITSLSDVVDKPWLTVKESLGQFAPQIAAASAGGAAGAALGSLAGPVGTAIGGAVGGLLPIFTQEYGGIRQDQIASGQEDKARALMAAIPATALERVGMGKALKVLKGVPIGAGSIAKEVGKGVLKEGATEGAQNVIEQVGAFKDPTTSENLGDTGLAAVMGGIGGGIMGGAGGAVDHLRNKSTETRDTAPGQEAPPAAPLSIGNTPDPLISFRDGSVARQSEVDTYLNSLPEEQRVAARAKLMGLAAQPVDIGTSPGANAPQTLPAAPPDALQTQGQPAPVEPPTDAERTAQLEEKLAFVQQQAQANGWDQRLIGARDEATAELDALRPAPEVSAEAPAIDQRPLSQQMGIDPNTGPLSSAAAMAVDSGAHAQAQQDQALQAAAEIAQKQRPAKNQEQPNVGPSNQPSAGLLPLGGPAGNDAGRGVGTAGAVPRDAGRRDAGASLSSLASNGELGAAPTGQRGNGNAPLSPSNFSGTPSATMGATGPTAQQGPSFGTKDAFAAIRASKQAVQPQGVTSEPKTDQAQQSITEPAQTGGAETAGPAATTTAGQPATAGGRGGQAAGVSNSTTAVAQGRVILQNRNRATPSSIAQMRSIAARPDYGRLGFSRDFANGAPVVAGGVVPSDQMGRQDVATASDGRRIPVQYAVVDAGAVLTSNRADGTTNTDYGNPDIPALRAIAGNGRIAGLQAAYDEGNTATYRQELAQDAALHGISPEVIATMAQPVLVRVMPADAMTADIGDVSNTVGNLDLSAVEQANNDANRVALDALQFAEDGSITPEVVRQFVRAMPQAERGQLLDTNGQPTRQAVDRLSAAVFAKAFGNDQLTNLYAQAQDPEARLIMSALAQVAPKMARLEGAGALDVRDVVAQAAEIAVNARRQGVTLARAAQQMDMASDPDVGVVLDLFAANSRSVRPVVEALERMADMAYTEASKPAEDMFGAVPRASRTDIINQLGPKNEQGSQNALEDATGREPVGQMDEGRGAEPAGRAAPTESQAGRSSENAAAQDGRVNEQGAEYSVRQQFSLFGLEQSDQLQLFIDSGPVPSQAGAGAVTAQREAVAALADMESAASILAKSLSRDFAARQKVRLVGHTVSSAADLAVLAQVYRDPRFETFRLVFTDNSGRVVSQLGISSRLPASSTVLVGDDLKSYLHEVSRAARKTGATSYYMLHNHPSGQATPSSADIELTKTFSRQLLGLTMRSHVVIDTNQYSVIDANGRPQFFQQDFAQPPQSLSGPLAGEVITSPADVVRMAQSLQADAGVITLIATDAQYKVKAVTSIPAATLNTGKGLLRLKIARALMRMHSANVFAVSRDEAGLRKLGGIVVDALHVKDDGSVNSLASAGTIASQPLGAFPSDRRARVSPDTTENFAYLRFDPSKTKSAG